MKCNELEQILEQQADGPLPEPASAHINGCAACRALAADLEAIHALAIELGTEEVSPPFLSLVLVAAGMISPVHVTVPPQLESRPEPPLVPSPEDVFKAEMVTVVNQNIPGFPAHDAAVTDSIRRNLNIVDNFIAMCKNDVREQPENEMAREYLYGAYKQKAELLATAMDRSGMGGLQ